MNFDARHHRLERRRFQVEQPGGRGADHDQLAGELGRRLLRILHYRLGRHEAVGIVPIEADPHPTVLVGRNWNALHRRALDADIVGADDDRTATGRHPQELERQRRPHDILRHHHERHPPDHPVAVMLDRQHAAPGSGGLELGNVADDAGIGQQERGRVGADRRQHRLGLACRPRLGDLALIAGMAQHHMRARDRCRQHIVIRRHFQQGIPHRRIDARQGRHIFLGRHAVGFREHDVEGNRRGAGIGDGIDKLRNPGARPRPLPIGGKAFLVDVDDHHPLLGGDTRKGDLIEVEGLQPQHFERCRVDQPQQERCQQHHEPGKARPDAACHSTEVPLETDAHGRYSAARRALSSRRRRSPKRRSARLSCFSSKRASSVIAPSASCRDSTSPCS